MLELPRNVIVRTGCFRRMMLRLCCFKDVFHCQLPTMEILFVGLRGTKVTLKSFELRKGRSVSLKIGCVIWEVLEHLVR